MEERLHLLNSLASFAAYIISSLFIRYRVSMLIKTGKNPEMLVRATKEAEFF